jgi:hypothetical protein
MACGGPCAEGNGGKEEAELPGAGFSSFPPLFRLQSTGITVSSSDGAIFLLRLARLQAKLLAELFAALPNAPFKSNRCVPLSTIHVTIS